MCGSCACGSLSEMKALFLVLLVLGATVAGSARADTLVIDRAHSKVEIAVHATVDSFVATLADYDAVLTVDQAGARVVGAAFRFKFADVKTGKAARDKHMHEWQHTEEFPDGEFTLDELKSIGDGQFTARGALRLHGVTKPLEFPVTITTDKTLFAVNGSTPLDTREFGLPVIRKFGLLKVNPVVTVRFHLQGVLPAH